MNLPVCITRILIVAALVAMNGTQIVGQTGLPTEKINLQAKESQPEKMYVHLDRPTYLVGETLWFKMWVTDEHLHAARLSSIGYLEVISGEGQAVIQAKVRLEKGKGSGALRIPSDIASGGYIVRGYTNWMKNFSEGHFFETSIQLINPFISLTQTIPENINAGSKPDLQFFPEGGYALAGVENKIAFKAQTPEGKGFDFTGRILDDDGRVIAEFKPRNYGIGHFFMTPEKGKNYKAEIIDAKGNRMDYTFEKITDDGYALHLTEEESQIFLQISTVSNNQAGPLHLLIYNGERSTAFQSGTDNGKAGFVIDKSKLKPGVNVLTLFNNKLQPVAERLYFNHTGRDASVSLSAGQTDFKKREQVSLQILPSQLRDTLDASVAVYLIDDLPETPQSSIDTYLLFTSELKGHIENPEYYFTGSDSAFEALDNVMLTHGWRRYSVEDLLAKEFTPGFLPEPDGHLITGRIVSQKDGAPLSQRTIYAAYPSARVMPWVALSDSKGEFILETRNFTGARELVVQTNFKRDSTNQIIINNPFAPVTRVPLVPALLPGQEQQADLLKRSINMQTQNSYFPIPKASLPSDSIPFYGKPDFRYYLDDYTRFPTMEEVLSEYIPTVMIRLRKGKYQTRVVETGVHKQLFSEDPLLLMDGIPVFDTDRIVQFDPLKVKRADVVNRMYFLGPLTFPGIVSYSTYTNDLSGFEVDPRALILAYDGTLEKREFYAPVYDKNLKNAHRLPDFRNLMYWSPSVKVAPGENAKLDFFTSDQTGRYRIVLQGLSYDGVPVSATSDITVTD